MLVDVSPDMSMYFLLRSQGYEEPYALAEFIDNAIHAHQDAAAKNSKIEQQLKIVLSFYSSNYRDANLKNSISIVDNGVGISGAHLVHALKPAKPPTQRGLSEFGIGMKAAAVWFAPQWSLHTRPIGEKVDHIVNFDLEKLVASGKHKVDVKQEDALKGRSAGTTIVLANLHKPITLDRYVSICDVITEIYQTFTRGSGAYLSLEATYDGGNSRKLNYEEPASTDVLIARTYKVRGKKLYLSGPEKSWSIPLSFHYMGGVVTGYLELRATGSYVNNPGLVLFRYGRVIKGLKSKPYSPAKLYKTANKYSKQRIYGELHMDGLPVSYMKDGFNINEDDFLEHILRIDGVEELMSQAESYRKDIDKFDSVIDEDLQIETEPKKPDLNKGIKQPGQTGEKPQEKKDGGPSNPATKPPLGPTNSPAAPKKPPAIPEPALTLFESLMQKTDNLALRSIIEETSRQYSGRRFISAALCLRVVLECGCLERIRKDFNSEYGNVSHMGIQALITHLNKNISQLSKEKPQGLIFNYKIDHVAIKCIQANKAGDQLDIILLNNISHGHFQPTKPTLDGVLRNIQPLLEWAYQ